MKRNILNENLFLHRLSNLQALCSSSSLELPNALVFVPGVDGKQNRGSLMIMKYLFQGSVGKDLYEASLDGSLDSLEESVLLIQESSVSIFWNRAAKDAVGLLLNSFPFVLEYCPTDEEEENVDKFEARKCEDFKRMMLENVPEGGVVGLPVPLGYDDVLDTENWPLLQSFALDSVVCPTGFFTSRYAVVDITESLDIMFCTIDGFYVERAVSVLRNNVLPHLDQVLTPIRNSHGIEQRQNIKASDIISPLQLLFEFGSMDAVFPVDPTLQPVVYLGAENSMHALGGACTNQKWNDVSVGSSLSAIIEAYEPSTGMRWCRTYFLQRGKCLSRISDPEALVSNEGKQNSESDSGADFGMTGGEESIVFGDVIERMEELHFKLCTSFRCAVKIAFSSHGDVLDAGGAVQELMHSYMIGEKFIGDEFAAVNFIKLKPSERLQVHMDCLNAHGQLVGIEDVDDMGGQCWTYIRVSVHGIAGIPGSHETFAIAMGDTFLFSPHYSKLFGDKQSDDISPLIFAHLQDVFCLTHSIPRSSYLLGPNAEESIARSFLSSTGSIHMLPALGLGSAISTSGSSLVSVAMLTDHPSVPVMNADLRLFASGFVVEKMDKCLSPFLISFGIHVKEMWTIDLRDCYRRVLSSKAFAGTQTSPITYIPEGFLVVLQLNGFDEQENFRGALEMGSNTAKSCIQYSMLDKILPNNGKVRYIAFCLSAEMSQLKVFSEAHHAWHRAARMYDIPDNRGSVNTFPEDILGPFLVMVDEESMKTVIDEVAFDDALTENGNFISGSLQIPGSGFFAMRANFMNAENTRLCQPTAASDKNGCDDRTRPEMSRLVDNSEPKNVVVVVGLCGSGVLNTATQVLNRLSVDRGPGISMSQKPVSAALALIDISYGDAEEACNCGVMDILSRNDSNNVVVAVVTSAAGRVPITSIISKIEGNGCRIAYLISIIGAPSTEKYLRSHNRTHGLGFETWAAAGKELLCCKLADFVIFIDQGHVSHSVDELFRSLRHDAISARMTPGQLWLDDDIIEAIMRAFKADTVDNGFGRKRCSSYSSFTVLGPQRMLGYKGLCCLRIPAPAGSRWDLERLESVMARLLFPDAVRSNTCSNEQWAVPPNNREVNGIARCIEIAKVKVMGSRQAEEGRRLFSDYISTVESIRCTSSIREGVLGVHAIVLKSSEDGKLILEANSGAIIIRCWCGDLSPEPTCNTINIQGVFSEKDINNLEDIFSRCTPHSLSERVPMTVDDLTNDDKTFIQKNYSQSPIPEGWWFDGASYIDVHGRKSSVHPDTNNLSVLFVAEKNEDIARCNDLLNEVKSYL